MCDIKMPKKLKVMFSNSVRNETHITFKNLGFIAKADGRFDIWAAGGFCNKPNIGIKVTGGSRLV